MPRDLVFPVVREKFVCVLCYLGGRFNGFQSQGGVTLCVQTLLEDAIQQVTQQQQVHVISSGRLDASTHASGMVVHFVLDESIAQEWRTQTALFAIKLHAILPQDIRLRSLMYYPESLPFNASSTVANKQYSYYVVQGKYNALWAPFAHYEVRKIDVDLLRQALQAFKGKHCFVEFCSGVKDLAPQDAIREINDITVHECTMLNPRLSLLMEKGLRRKAGLVYEGDQKSPVDSAWGSTEQQKKYQALQQHLAMEETSRCSEENNWSGANECWTVLSGAYPEPSSSAPSLSSSTSALSCVRQTAPSAPAAAADSTILCITFRGEGFLRYQVRRMVGAAISIAVANCVAKVTKEGKEPSTKKAKVGEADKKPKLVLVPSLISLLLARSGQEALLQQCALNHASDKKCNDKQERQGKDNDDMGEGGSTVKKWTRYDRQHEYSSTFAPSSSPAATTTATTLVDGLLLPPQLDQLVSVQKTLEAWRIPTCPARGLWLERVWYQHGIQPAHVHRGEMEGGDVEGGDVEGGEWERTFFFQPFL